MQNALLHEQFVNNKNGYLTPSVQSSWCANFNSTGEWIQVSLPKSEYWQGMMISGNPRLGNYVTEMIVELANDNGNEEDFIRVRLSK